MKRTFALLFAASLTMLGLDLSGQAHLPWWVVLIPVAVPAIEWAGIGALAVAIIFAAPFIEAADNRRRAHGKKTPGEDLPK